MSSIYDELYRRRVSRRQPTVAEGRRHDLVADRLCMVDGIAINAAGVLLSNGGLPEIPMASPCPLLINAQGFPRLAKLINTIALNERHAGLDGRLMAIWQVIAGSLDAFIRQIPDDEKVDLVLTLPESISPWLQQSLQQQIIEQLSERQVWQDGQSLCRVGAAQNINALLAPDADSGAMRWVFWCSLDTLLDDSQLRHWDQLSTKNSPIIAGEGGALILFERMAPAALPSRGRFWVHSKIEAHAPSRSLASRPRTEALKSLMKVMVPPSDSAEEDASVEPPACCIMDMGAGDRAGDAFMALFDRWPGVYEPMVNCHALDHFCGWIGQAALSVMLMMAAASMEEDGSAMLLSLCGTDASAMTLLTPVIADAQV